MSEATANTPPAADDADLEGELATLLAPGGDGRRGCPVALLAWCARAGATLLRDGTLSAVGLRAMRTLAVILAERQDLLTPELAAWLAQTVVPCLCPATAGGVAAAHADIAYLLLRAMVEWGQQRPPPPAAVEDAPRAARPRRAPKRRLLAAHAD